MLRKHWQLCTIGALVVLVMVAVSFFLRPEAAANSAAPPLLLENPLLTEAQQVTARPIFAFSYAAKFVCGFQPFSRVDQERGETIVKPGNYATEINIHNPHYKNIKIVKKVVLLVEQGQPIGREPKAVPPRKPVVIGLLPDYATMDDCNALWPMIYGDTAALPSPMPLMIGYLVILSRSPYTLDVDAVYTAAPDLMQPGQEIITRTGVSSIDVERIEPQQRVQLSAIDYPGLQQ